MPHKTRPRNARPAPIYDVACQEQDGLPVVLISGGEGHPQAHHPLAGWRLKANVYLNGMVRLFSGEFGSRFFGPGPFHPLAWPAELHLGKRSIVLDYNQLGAQRELGLSTFSAQVLLPEGTLTQRVVIPDLHSRALFISYSWEGGPAPVLHLPLMIPADAGPYGKVYYTASGEQVVQTAAMLTASLARPLLIRAGYAPDGTVPPPPTADDLAAAFSQAASAWRTRLDRIVTPLTGARRWELRWSTALMLSTCVWDGTRQQLACANGALYAFDHLSPEFNQPRGMYSFRDGNQVAYALCTVAPDVAREQILRNFPAFRREWGIPQMSTALPGSEYLYKTPGSELGEVLSVAYASDQPYWLIFALTEYVRVTGDTAILAERRPNGHGEAKTVRQHVADMLRFTDDTVGYGPNGLCRFLSGDWSDFLDEIGARGRGESFMNAALMILAKSRLAALDEAAGDAATAARLRAEAGAMRARVAPYCSGPWYPRGITDDGRLLGGPGDRLFAETQPWLALAECGTPAFRRQALLSTLEHCLDPAGLLIMDRPLQPHERPGVTRIPYAPGTGENGGLWWLCGFWLAMALEQEGLPDAALKVYDQCSMANHHQLFPREWWSPMMCPDGIDGPASPHYGRPQQPPGFNRESNPNEVAKFAYKLWFATHRGGAARWCW